METKNLVEQLRDMVELSIKSNQYPPVHADAILGHLCVSKSDEQELFATIADRIEREYLPLPLLEGEPLKVGDLVLWNDGGAKRVEDIKVEVYLEGSCGTCRSVLKRPELDTMERIEADALMKAGDYCMEYDVDCLIGECEKAMRLDLLRRQREVLERGKK